MKLVINGKDVELRDGLTVAELLKEHKVRMPDMVSVELNGTILERDSFASTVVKDGDQVEFIYFMGGGRAII
ncbi:MAG: sulfur carrier protein ThiS [Phycisphaerae bacterium]|jgi:sulfur carrier protein|nr:sulfur carrier protein ThiS [Phycisphaerae bacterium]